MISLTGSEVLKKNGPEKTDVSLRQFLEGQRNPMRVGWNERLRPHVQSRSLLKMPLLNKNSKQVSASRRIGARLLKDGTAGITIKEFAGGVGERLHFSQIIIFGKTGAYRLGIYRGLNM